jgi:hypothetical protein
MNFPLVWRGTAIGVKYWNDDETTNEELTMPIKPKEMLRCDNCHRPISRYGISSVNPANCQLCTPNASVAGQRQVAGVSPLAVSAGKKAATEAVVKRVQAKRKKKARKKKAK